MQALLTAKEYFIKKDGFNAQVPSLTVEKKKITSLMGKSGSGKSTVLLSFAGFITAQKGSLIYQEKEISILPPEERGLGLVFQKSALFPHLSVLENVEFGLKMRGESKATRTEKAMQWLKNLHVDGLAKKNALEVSGGEAQRIALARVLVMDFSVILLDEPFSALDEELKKELRAQLKELIEKYDRGALIVTHDSVEAKELASISYRIENGLVSLVE